VNKGVLYLCCGSKHGVHLIVSLASLRQYYTGPVAIACELSGPGKDVAEACAADPRLGPIIVVSNHQMQAGGKGVSYLTKTLLPKVTPFESTIFIDADTLIVGKFEELWPRTPDEVVLTHFCDWYSRGHKMTGRIKEWQEVEPERVARMLSKDWPAINTGVVCWGKDTAAFADDWHATSSKRRVFITDELAAQLIYPDHNVRVVDWRYNASVVFDIGRKETGEASIWHGHGFKFWKRPNAWAWIYRDFYLGCLEANAANIRAVWPGDKVMRLIPAADRKLIESMLTCKLTEAV
jgi:hypothetical protein